MQDRQELQDNSQMSTPKVRTNKSQFKSRRLSKWQDKQSKQECKNL